MNIAKLTDFQIDELQLMDRLAYAEILKNVDWMNAVDKQQSADLSELLKGCIEHRQKENDKLALWRTQLLNAIKMKRHQETIQSN